MNIIITLKSCHELLLAIRMLTQFSRQYRLNQGHFRVLQNLKGMKAIWSKCFS